jgi:glycosyltransferase involved in cell wall biosynthesis
MPAHWHRAPSINPRTIYARILSRLVRPASFPLLDHSDATALTEHMSSISVVIPAFNNGAYVEEAVRTVLAQTQPPDEVIVVDDGSADDTERVVRAIKDDRVQYHWQANSGVSVARNRGLDLARGVFVSFLDADDRWRPQTLERQLRLMSADPELICCFGNFVRFTDGSSDFLTDQFTFYPELASTSKRRLSDGSGWVLEGDAFDAVIPFGDFPAFTQTMMFRASAIRDVRFDKRLIRCQDADFVLRVFLRGRVAFTEEILAEVRRHSNNATREVSLMPLDKLRALECVREDPLAGSHRSLLESRLMRARFDAAGVLMRRGRQSEGLAHWGSALRTEGPILRKLTGSLRLTGFVLAGLGPRSLTPS